MDPEYLSNAQVERLNHTLQQLEGKELDYVGLSYGKVKTETTLCTLELCRASLVTLSWSHKRLVCVELVGDRFLRRMVRILVSTALRQVLSEEDPGKHEEDALIHLIETRERKLAARAAPPFGLIFVSAQVT
jgi:tRNA U38,U39,U40 pseudouridine synthase TruA